MSTSLEQGLEARRASDPDEIERFRQRYREIYGKEPPRPAAEAEPDDRRSA